MPSNDENPNYRLTACASAAEPEYCAMMNVLPCASRSAASRDVAQTRRSIWTYIAELKKQEEITIFMTTHYMDEAEWCDRIAIMDHGQIVALDAPETLKAQVGTDRVMIHVDDDEAAIAALKEQFGIEARVAEGAVTFGVAEGEQFVPRLFAELGIPIKAVHVSRPTLDDVFMSYTGTTIRDAEEDQAKNRNRVMMQVMHGGGRR